MADDKRHESADLTDYEALDAFDTLSGADENATEEDIARLLRAQGPDPRAGRLVGDDEGTIDDDEVSLVAGDDRLARDVGIDGGAATAEEAAIHVIDVDTEGTTN